MATEEAVYQRFVKAARESLRLEAALEGYFRHSGCSGGAADLLPKGQNRGCVVLEGAAEAESFQKHDQEYRAYLKRRIRPAAEYLIKHSESEKLLVLWKDGLLTEPVLTEAARMAQKSGNALGWIRCMQMLNGGTEEECAQAQRTGTGPTDGSVPGRMSGRGYAGIENGDLSDTSDMAGTESSGSGTSETEASRSRASLRILQNARNRLYELFPDLDSAVSVLEPQESVRTQTIGTDGYKLLYNPDFVFSLGEKEPRQIARIYLHVLLHCLYQDWKQCEVPVGTDHRVGRDAGRCQAGGELRPDDTAGGDYAGGFGLSGNQNEDQERPASADAQIERIIDQEAGDALAVSCFVPDDHGLWPDPESEQADDLNRLWESLAGKTGTGSGRGGAGHFGIGTNVGTESEQAGRIRRSTYDYRRFLEHFAVFGEAMETDGESFDYSYYALGTQLYGNMPLIEPLEYKEGHRLQELVIAIDTSGSCSLELVQRFLAESYAILGRKENFFQKMKVYFIQCDLVIQDVALIRSREDWMRYIDHLQIKGRAGTDFTPVFRYVEELRRKKALTNLKGLIYFTDGNGVYPTKAPDYETAFVFVRKELFQEKVPGWALQLELDSN